MAQAATVLTDAKLTALKAPASGQAEISDAKVPGLRIRVGPQAKTFILRKRIGGKLRNITIGRYGPRFGLADARKKARTLISDIEAGRDPTTTLATPRREGKGADTIRALWPDYKADRKGLRSIGEIERIFEKYILPEMGDRLADAVTRADVTRFIDGIAKSAPVMARAVHAQLSAFYKWALPRLDRLPGNPCRDAGRPDKPKSRETTLDNDQLRALWLALADECSPWQPGIRLLILTGQRRDEVFNADRAEFDLEGALWTIPRERAKNDVEHLVPLPDAAVAIVAGIPEIKGSAKLFAARSNPDNGPSGFSKAMARIRPAVAEKLGGDVQTWTLHDLRRTVATGMQKLGIRMEVVEAVLNHVSGSRGGIVGVYQRHKFLEEKRHALNAWAAEVERIVTATDRGNVVAING